MRQESICLCNKRNDKFHIYILEGSAYKQKLRKFKYFDRLQDNLMSNAPFLTNMLKNVKYVKKNFKKSDSLAITQTLLIKLSINSFTKITVICLVY